jgi:hypothetical protein
MDKSKLVQMVEEYEEAQVNVTNAKFKLMNVERAIVTEFCNNKEYHMLKVCINSMRYQIKH